MKKGLLVYPHNSEGIFNIGDYVQSIAARQFMHNPEIFINRESLDKYEGEPVSLIMNGWFMHNPENWPPSEKVHPLFVSFHLNTLAEKGMLSEDGIAYLKRHQPVGCRDRHTVDLLKANGIDAYFSGCLTLTLGLSYKHIEKKEAPIYLTDLNSRLPKDNKFRIKCATVLLTRYSLLKKIQRRMGECGINKALRSVIAFYVTYSPVISDEVLMNAIYKEQEICDTFSSDKEKFEYADKLLRDYSEARYVVTSRIHCALPSLAMGTPVVFVTDSKLGNVNNCRLDGLKQLFHTIEIVDGRIGCNVPGIDRLTLTSRFENKPDYLTIANNLTDKCRSFCRFI